jgi:hypothetical protein
MYIIIQYIYNTSILRHIVGRRFDLFFGMKSIEMTV